MLLVSRALGECGKLNVEGQLNIEGDIIFDFANKFR